MVSSISKLTIDILTHMTESYLEFYHGKANFDGLKLHEVWKYTDCEYDGYHDFIQWVFPSDEPSMILRDAPVVTEEDAVEFRESASAQIKLFHSYRQFLGFLGIKIDLRGDLVIVDQGKFYQRVCRRNHNLQRITRVLRSLYILGLPERAQQFHQFLVDADKEYGLNQISMDYWSNAVN